MQELCEEKLVFSFPDNLPASKYDDWLFYRSGFVSKDEGKKAVDFIVLDKQITWLIEVKDYRVYPRTKLIDLGDEIAFKVINTLEGLREAINNADDPKERELANIALRKKRNRVVLHLEQPKKRTRFRPRAIDPARVKRKLKQRLKSIDPHPLVVSHNNLHNEMKWSVRSKRNKDNDLCEKKKSVIFVNFDHCF